MYPPVIEKLNDLETRMAISETTMTAVVNKLSDLEVQISGMLLALVPAGVPLPWSGSINAVPDGWLLCDGQNGTPDLRDKFIVGAGGTYAVGATGGSGSHSHSITGNVGDTALTIAQMPSHSHNINVPRASTGIGSVTSGSLALANPPAASSTNNAGGDQPHDHPFEGSAGTSSSLPPYYALAYIIRRP